MSNDEEFSAIVSCSFPDEAFDTFEEWRAAQCSDDTGDRLSDLWRGGGQWLLYGLGLTLGCQIFVTNVSSSGDTVSTPHELVDGRPDGIGRTVHLGAMLGDDG